MRRILTLSQYSKWRNFFCFQCELQLGTDSFASSPGREKGQQGLPWARRAWGRPRAAPVLPALLSSSLPIPGLLKLAFSTGALGLDQSWGAGRGGDPRLETEISHPVSRSALQDTPHSHLTILQGAKCDGCGACEQGAAQEKDHGSWNLGQEMREELCVGKSGKDSSGADRNQPPAFIL